MNQSNRIDTSKIIFVDQERFSDFELSEARRYIDLLQADGKLQAPLAPVKEYVFCMHGGCLDAEMDDGSKLYAMGAGSISDEWCWSEDREKGIFPANTDGIARQQWSRGAEYED
jgi:hypothetical protein